MERSIVWLKAVSLLFYLSFSTVCVLPIYAQELETLHMVSKWGFSIADGIQLLVKLSNEPARAAEYGAGAAVAIVGGGTGKKLGEELGEAIGGEGLGLLGKVGLGAAGAVGGAKLGAALGGGIDRARIFFAQEEKLLENARLQQLQILEAMNQARIADEGLTGELKNIDLELAKLSDLTDKMKKALCYNPFVAKTINDNKVFLRDRTITHLVKLDRISNELGL